MIKMNQPAISFSTTSTKNDELALETDEPEEMEKLEYSESDDEDILGDMKHDVPTGNKLISNSTSITDTVNTNGEHTLEAETTINAVLEENKVHDSKPNDILDLKDKLNACPKIENVESSDAAQEGNDKTVEKIGLLETENDINSKISTEAILTINVDVTMTDVEMADVADIPLPPELNSNKTHADDKIVEANVVNNENIDPVEPVRPESDSLSQNTDVNENCDVADTDVNADVLETEKTNNIDPSEDQEDDRLLAEIEEAISNSEGANSNSTTSDNIVPPLEENSKSDSQELAVQTDNLDADDSLGNLMIDESNLTESDLSTESIETDINDCKIVAEVEGTLTIDESKTIEETNENITETVMEIPSNELEDVNMDGVDEEVVVEKSNNEPIVKTDEPKVVSEMDAIPDTDDVVVEIVQEIEAVPAEPETKEDVAENQVDEGTIQNDNKHNDPEHKESNIKNTLNLPESNEEISQVELQLEKPSTSEDLLILPFDTVDNETLNKDDKASCTVPQIQIDEQLETNVVADTIELSAESDVPDQNAVDVASEHTEIINSEEDERSNDSHVSENSTSGKRKRLSTETLNHIDNQIKKPRINLDLPFDDTELVETNNDETDKPNAVNNENELVGISNSQSSGIIVSINEDVEMEEEKVDHMDDETRELLIPTRFLNKVNETEEEENDVDNDDDKPLSSIKSPASNRPSVDSIESVENEIKTKFSEISKTIDETSSDLTEEPIKSVPKSLSFLKKFKCEMKNWSSDDLEELVLQKIVEALVCKSHMSQLQEKVEKQHEVINNLRTKFTELSKLYKDLEMVHLRVLRDMEIKNEGYLVPVKITRAVGLQVTQDRGKFSQTETTIKNLVETNCQINFKTTETKSTLITPVASPSSSLGSIHSTASSPGGAPLNQSNNQSTNSNQLGGEVKKSRTVQKFTPMRPQLTPAQQLQIQKQTQQEKQLLLQQQKQKILLQKQHQQNQQQQQQSQTQQTQHQQTMQQKIAQSQQNIQRQQAAMQAQQQQQQQRSPILQAAAALKNLPMIIPRPLNGVVTTTPTTPSSLIIKKTTITNRVVQTQSLTAPTNVVTNSSSSSIVSSTTSTPCSTPTKSVIDLTDEEDPKVPEQPKVNILNGQPPALVAIPGQKGVNKLTYVIRNPVNNNKVLVQNVPQLSQTRVTLQKVPGTTNKYGMSKSEVNRLYYLTHRTRLLMRRKERHGRNKQLWNNMSSSSPELPIAPKNSSPAKPGMSNLQSILTQVTPAATPVTISTPANERIGQPTVTIPRSVTHPAPLPNPTYQNSDPTWRRIPPRPIVRINNTNSGIVISWSLDSTRGGYADIVSYQIYAYQETPSPPTTETWRHVGDVKAMLLPMAVTLTHFEEGRRYFFAVRAVDEHNRVGVFSLPKTW